MTIGIKRGRITKEADYIIIRSGDLERIKASFVFVLSFYNMCYEKIYKEENFHSIQISREEKLSSIFSMTISLLRGSPSAIKT